MAVLSGGSRGSCGAGGRAQWRRGRAPWGQAKGKACGHSPALVCLVFGRLRQAAALPGLGILSLPPPAAAPAGTLRGRTMLIPRPCSAPASLQEGVDGNRPQQCPRQSSLSQAGHEGASSSTGPWRVLLRAALDFRAISPGSGVRWIPAHPKGDAAPCSKDRASAPEPPSAPGVLTAQPGGGGGS